MSTQTNNSTLPPVINLTSLEVQQLENYELKETLVRQQRIILQLAIGKRVGVDVTQYNVNWQQGVMILKSASQTETNRHQLPIENINVANNIKPVEHVTQNQTNHQNSGSPTISTHS